MPLPKALGRLNRRGTNRVMRRLAWLNPLLGTIVHRGRRSGRLYRTPVLVFPEGATVTIALTYGADTDWLKNVRAAGECWLIHRGERLALSAPRMLPTDVGQGRMPAPIRLPLRLLAVDEFVELTTGPNLDRKQANQAEAKEAGVEARSIETFWREARAALGPDAPEEPPPAWPFGDSPELADELLALVMEGRKTATCASLWAYEAENEPLPAPGDLWIVLDGAGRPACVLETTEVRVMPMNEVDAQFAYDEGEDDRTWESWYAAHERYFSRTLPAIGRQFDPTMPVVLERFRRRYP